MKKKYNSLLIIRKSSAEIDWILPVLNEMKKNTNFYTLFTNEKAYKSLENSSFLFNNWNKISKDFYVQKKTDKIIYKALRKAISFSSKSKLKKIINNKIHNINYLKRKLNLNKNQKFDFILNEFQKTSHWANMIIKNNYKTKLFLFPHTTHIYKYDKNRTKEILKNKLIKYCDGLFLGSKEDTKIWKNRLDNNKIHVTGHPKYDYGWQRNFFEKIKNKKKKIVFAVKDIIDDSSKELTNKYLNILYKICEKNNYLLVIKLPPYPQNELSDIMNKIKERFNSQIFWITNKNIFTILNKSNLLININLSATSLDALSFGLPVIQLPVINKKKGKFGNNDSIYTKLKLVTKVSNINKLESAIKQLLKNKSNYKNNLKKNFLKYFPKYKNSSKKISKIILNQIN